MSGGEFQQSPLEGTNRILNWMHSVYTINSDSSTSFQLVNPLSGWQWQWPYKERWVNAWVSGAFAAAPGSIWTPELLVEMSWPPWDVKHTNQSKQQIYLWAGSPLSKIILSVFNGSYVFQSFPLQNLYKGGGVKALAVPEIDIDHTTYHCDGWHSCDWKSWVFHDLASYKISMALASIRAWKHERLSICFTTPSQ